jgi:phage host-nuclease inhibitor protein Gam
MTNKTPKPVSREQAEKASKAYADAVAGIESIDANSKRQIATIESAAATKKSELATTAAQAEATLQLYAQQNPALFTEKKSIALPGCEIGYRLTAKTVEIPKDQEGLIKKMQKFLPAFIKTTTTIVKAGLATQDKALLKKCGLEVTGGEEKFFVKAS